MLYERLNVNLGFFLQSTTSDIANASPVQDTGQPAALKPPSADAASSLPGYTASPTAQPQPQAQARSAALPTPSDMHATPSAAAAQPDPLSSSNPPGLPDGNAGSHIPGIDRPLHVFRRPQAVADASTPASG